MLSPETQQLWEEYLPTEKRRIRAVSNAALARFIDALLEEAPTAWKTWAQRFAIRVVKGEEDTPVRVMLLKRVVAPALVAGVAQAVKGCANAVVQLKVEDHPALPGHLRSRTALLREALRLDPADNQARESLARELFNGLSFAVHEAPAMMLMPEGRGCEDLLRELEEVRGHLRILGGFYARWPLEKCELYLTAYRDYLRAGSEGSFNDFVGRREAPFVVLEGGARTEDQ